MKTCTRCGELKTFECFPTNKAAKDGRYRLCKPCNAAVLKERNASAQYKEKRQGYLAKNRDRVNEQAKQSYWRRVDECRARQRARRERSKQEWIERARKWRAENPERVKRNRERWFAERPGYVNERGMRRYAHKGKATPAWADKAAIREVYARAAYLTQILGEQYHVDHIYPLMGEVSCGLHIASNLRVISAKDNRRKSNKMPEEMSA